MIRTIRWASGRANRSTISVAKMTATGMDSSMKVITIRLTLRARMANKITSIWILNNRMPTVTKRIATEQLLNRTLSGEIKQ